MVKVKICGITNLEDGLAACAAGADSLGFIFTKKSPRYIKPQDARKIISQLDPFTAKVGVFVDENIETVIETIKQAGLTAVQLHGSEPGYYAHKINEIAAVIKVFFTGNKPLHESISPYRVNSYLFDIRYEDKINGSKQLSTSALAQIKQIINSGCRVIISSGLTSKNLAKVLSLKPYAVDVSSGVEDMPGKKNHQLMREFIQRVKGI